MKFFHSLLRFSYFIFAWLFCEKKLLRRALQSCLTLKADFSKRDSSPIDDGAKNGEKIKWKLFKSVFVIQCLSFPFRLIESIENSKGWKKIEQKANETLVKALDAESARDFVLDDIPTRLPFQRWMKVHLNSIFLVNALLIHHLFAVPFFCMSEVINFCDTEQKILPTYYKFTIQDWESIEISFNDNSWAHPALPIPQHTHAHIPKRG